MYSDRSHRMWILAFIWGQVLLFPLSLRSENVKIVEIIDANLFKTKDGRYLRLAEVCTPSEYDPDHTLSRFAREIMREAGKDILKQRLSVTVDSGTTGSGDTLAVHLWRKYDLGNFSLNRHYLEMGFGFYAPSPGSLFCEEYKKAAEKAVRNRKGIWDPNLFSPYIAPKWDHRVRFLSGMIRYAKYKQDKQTFLFTLNKRWSYFRSPDSPLVFRTGFSWELGSYMFILPYVLIGPEIRMGNILFISPHAGSVFLIHPVFGGYKAISGRTAIPYFYGVKIGGLFWRGKNSRFEWEVGMQWLLLDKSEKPLLTIGLGRGF